jgi:hypothetical protein
VEHKARRRLPAWLTRALQQARDGAEGRTPLVVLSQVRQGVRARRYALLALDDLADLVTGDPADVLPSWPTTARAQRLTPEDFAALTSQPVGVGGNLAPARRSGVSAPCVRPSHYDAIDVPITALTADPRLQEGAPCDNATDGARRHTTE